MDFSVDAPSGAIRGAFNRLSEPSVGGREQTTASLAAGNLAGLWVLGDAPECDDRKVSLTGLVADREIEPGTRLTPN